MELAERVYQMSDNDSIRGAESRRDEIARIVLEVVQKSAAMGKVPQRDMSLFDDMGFDVLDVVDICMEVEEKVGVYLDFDVDVIETVGDLIETVQRCAGRVG